MISKHVLLKVCVLKAKKCPLGRARKENGLAVTVCFHKKPQPPRDPDQQQNEPIPCSRGSAYFVEYLRIYWTNFRNLFTI